MPSKFKSKPGTLGRSIEKLVRKCKSNPLQFFVLETALKEACGVKTSGVITIDGVLVGSTPGYKAAAQEFDKIMSNCGLDRPATDPAATEPK